MTTEPLIPRHGGYRNLKSFQIARLCYDVTVRFCDRYVPRRSRTHDQMVQAARSGVQNIAEGSKASGTSRKTELKLTNVARASLEELRLDYEDFLRQRGLPVWAHEDPRRGSLVARRCQTADEVAQWVVEEARQWCGKNGRDGHDGLRGQKPPCAEVNALSMTSTVSTTSTEPSSLYPEFSANAALILIAVACSLLDRQLAAQADAFLEEGGFTERLYRVRTAKRKQGSS